MKKRNNTIIFLAVVIALVAVLIWWMWPAKNSVAPTINNNATNAAANVNATNTNATPATMIEFSTADLPGRDSQFKFDMNIPLRWEVSYDAGLKAIYILNTELSNVIEVKNSQLLIQYYTGTVHRPDRAVVGEIMTKQINNQSAREYLLASDQSETIPTGYPDWWSSARSVVEFNKPDGAGINYVFNFAPTVDQATKDLISSSINLD